MTSLENINKKYLAKIKKDNEEFMKDLDGNVRKTSEKFFSDREEE